VTATRRARGLLLALALLLVAGCGTSPAPRASPYHDSDADLTVTRIVHGSVILDLRGTRFLVDPWFHPGYVVRQAEPLGLKPDALPDAAAVLLTHRHSDHFDPKVLRTLAPRIPRVIAPRDLHGRLEKLGFETITDLEWWEKTDVGDVVVTAVPARHSVPENGYVLEREGTSVYLAGDTTYFPELVDVATRFPHLDAALLPVGGRRLVGLRREMGPDDAAKAAALLDARRVIPIAYGETGGFPIRWFARRPAQRFVEQCKKRGISGDRVVVLEAGESWHYYRQAGAGT
jgi:L-ascorbate metabolism protein UlaG (beta-lactamase superfamily)